MSLYVDELPDSWTIVYGQYEVTHEAVIDFASKFDPQDFHLDDEAAAKGPFGRLTASGWHTSAISMRMMVDEFQRIGLTTLGSPGLEAINFLKPVHPGDILSAELTLLERRPSNTRPDRVIAKLRTAIRNQNNEVVWTARHIGFFPRKPVQD